MLRCQPISSSSLSDCRQVYLSGRASLEIGPVTRSACCMLSLLVHMYMRRWSERRRVDGCE